MSTEISVPESVDRLCSVLAGRGYAQGCDHVDEAFFGERTIEFVKDRVMVRMWRDRGWSWFVKISGPGPETFSPVTWREYLDGVPWDLVLVPLDVQVEIAIDLLDQIEACTASGSDEMEQELVTLRRLRNGQSRDREVARLNAERAASQS